VSEASVGRGRIVWGPQTGVWGVDQPGGGRPQLPKITVDRPERPGKYRNRFAVVC
jgi:hypothetical protein